MDLQLSNKVALVSGANRGTGAIIAQQLASEGARVIIHRQEKDSSSYLETAFTDSLPSNCFCVYGDLTTDEGAQEVFDQSQSFSTELDILVNNYGQADPGSWQHSSAEDWIKSYQKNVLSAVRLINLFLPQMKTQKTGRIIQLGTIGALKPNSRMPQYYAAKATLANLTVSLSKELANTGITVNAISPGLIKTEEIEAYYKLRAEKKNWGQDWDDIESAIAKYDFPNPCGRIARREEVADLVSFLASPRASYINGQTIRIDGGALELAI